MNRRDQVDQLEKAESLTRQALQMICGTTSFGNAKLPDDAKGALENLSALIGRRLTQAKDGASGFQQAVADELVELKQHAQVVDADIKASVNCPMVG
jgi:hypothetical protein